MIPKFRAWHKTWEEMGKVTCIHFDDKQSVISMFCEEEQASSALLDDEVILMQSTGLFDRNGKEIFEGDIVTDGDVISDIKYHQTLGFYMIGKYGFSVPFGQGVDVEYFEEFAVHVSKIFEVIGNIYENPELLEVE